MPREVAARYAAGFGDSPPSIKLGALLDACETAGVDLGLHDRQVLSWLSNWEPTTVQVFVDLIERAAAGPAVPSLDDAPVGTRAYVEGEPAVGIRDLDVVRISANRNPDAKVWAEVGAETARWTSITLTEHDAEITYMPRKVAQ
jgi:hypothetical protein